MPDRIFVFLKIKNDPSIGRKQHLPSILAKCNGRAILLQLMGSPLVLWFSRAVSHNRIRFCLNNRSPPSADDFMLNPCRREKGREFCLDTISAKSQTKAMAKECADIENSRSHFLRPYPAVMDRHVTVDSGEVHTTLPLRHPVIINQAEEKDDNPTHLMKIHSILLFRIMFAQSNQRDSN